jgi:hypothetical protein
MAQQRELTLVRRRKVRVPALGGKGVVTAAVPEQPSLTQSGARDNDSGVAATGRLARLDLGEVIG